MAKDKWIRVSTSVPPGMKKLVEQQAAIEAVDEAVVLRTALRRYLQWDPRVHETKAFLGYDPGTEGDEDS